MTAPKTTGGPASAASGTSGTPVTFPEVTDPRAENSPAAFVSHTLLQTQRLLLRWIRDPSTMVQAIVYPALMLLMLWSVLGISITRATGTPSIFGTAPMMTIVGAMFGSIASGLALRQEWASGLLSRFWVLPVHRASGLTSRLLAEAVRIMLTTVLIVAVGFALGFRFDQGILPGLLMMLIPLLLGLGFATMVTALAVASAKLPLVELLSLFATLLLFFNSGFVPTNAYPTWLQTFVENQPMSCAIDAMRGLSLGGPVAEPLIKTVIWSVGAILLFAYPAVRGFRRAAGTPP
ncbi:ABC transporter permease [Rhodococcus triatomae]|uniref:Transport permease protein n=1 Tax=Rhodococcus triatomae TaxID=300028 RepID=A0A1G8RC93_9NOCA|nr:ABC transporter permease [Rhodococcus triatomae]QNG19640.1 ABC transporter permease [Rhodococcus triatomae]QNG24445.1 ABC transporter permease [Rhodococcus triatomae]SDJ14664.1 ABC-2 type transport system permease protein [Rhodococcus triatomae]